MERPPRAMVPGYRHVPGNHCGSTALRNLLAFHGAEISEEMALGLGAGVSFYYVALDGLLAVAVHQRARRPARGAVRGADRRRRSGSTPSPSPRLPGRRRGPPWTRGVPRSCSPTSTTWTTTAARRTFPATPWSSPATTPRSPTSRTPRSRSSRQRVSTSSPEPATASIRCSPSTATCSRFRRERSRATSGRPRRTRSRETPSRCSTLRSVSTRACRRCAGSRPRWASWPEQVEDWQWCARFCYQVIERRGTGGGNFRLMYSRFLDEAGRERGAAGRAGRGAGGRRSPSGLLAASEAEEPQPELWSRVDAAAAEVLDAEERLWPALARYGRPHLLAGPTGQAESAQALKRAK